MGREIEKYLRSDSLGSLGSLVHAAAQMYLEVSSSSHRFSSPRTGHDKSFHVTTPQISS
jgi:hypothetical protein